MAKQPVTNSNSSDRKLVESVLAGNAADFNVLIERHFELVYFMAYARLGQRESAEDLAQEVFLRAYLALKDLRDPALFSAWLSRITRNLALDWLRKGERASRLISKVPLDEVAGMVEDNSNESADKMMETKEQNNAVHDAIMKLPAEMREIVILHYIHDLNITNISQKLGLSRWAVSYQLKKAIKLMKSVLAPVIQESAPVFRPQRKAALRTIAAIGVISAMSASSKSAMAATAGGLAKVSAASLAKSGGAVAVGSVISILKSVPATYAAGGALMGLKQAFAVGITAVIALGGTGYYYYERSQKVQQQPEEAQVFTFQGNRVTMQPGMAPGMVMGTGRRVNAGMAPAEVKVNYVDQVRSTQQMQQKFESVVDKLREKSIGPLQYELQTSTEINLSKDTTINLVCMENDLNIKEYLIGPLEGEIHFWAIFNDGSSTGTFFPMSPNGNVRWANGPVAFSAAWSSDDSRVNIAFNSGRNFVDIKSDSPATVGNIKLLNNDTKEIQLDMGDGRVRTLKVTEEKSSPGSPGTFSVRPAPEKTEKNK